MGNTLTQPKAVAPAAFEKELTQLDQGVLLELPGNVSLTINGVSVNAAAIDTTLQSWITVFKAVDSAKASYKNAVSARVAITTAAKAYVKALKAVVKAYFGPQGTQLASFGIATDQPVERTAQQKLVSAAKAKQTRAVRGTTSKKQKAALTVVGNPPVLVPSTGPQGIAPPTRERQSDRLDRHHGFQHHQQHGRHQQQQRPGIAVVDAGQRPNPRSRWFGIGQRDPHLRQRHAGGLAA